MLRPPPRSPLFPYTTLFRSSASPSAPVTAPAWGSPWASATPRSEEHTSELQSLTNLVCRLLLEKKKHTVVPMLQLPIADIPKYPATQSLSTDWNAVLQCSDR